MKNISEAQDIKILQNKLEEMALEIAKSMSVNLDYSIESIQKIEEILAKVHDAYKNKQIKEGLDGIALEFAAYIVAVIEKNIGDGKWERNSPEIGDETFPFTLPNGKVIFPYAWNLKRIYDGPGDNVWTKFQVLVLEN